MMYRSFVLAMVLCGFTGLSEAAQKKEEKPPVSVFVEKLSPLSFYEELKFVANIQPFREVKVFSFIDGNVAAKYKNNGDFVQKGEPIAAIKNITPGYSFANHVIKAPISGVLTGFYQEVGTFVRKSPAVLSVADVSRWRVSVPVPQQDLKLLSDRALFRVALRVNKGRLVHGELLRVSPNVDPVLGTSVAEFVFDKKNLPEARLGMVSELRVQYNEVESIGVDEKFIMESRSRKKPYVYIVKPDLTVERRYLEKGVVRDGRVQIKEGLKAGEVIVTKMPNWGLRHGQKIKPENKVQFLETTL